MKKNINLRSLAAQAIEQVVEKGQSLSNVLPPLQQKVSDKDKALLQELCFGVLRTLSQLEWLISKLMARPMTGKQRTVHFLIMVGLYQLLYTRIPPHAALAETVEGAVAIKRPQLKGLINGVLRQFQRQQEALLAEFAEHENRYLHPKWLLKRLQQAWPQQWQEIVEANNQRLGSGLYALPATGKWRTHPRSLRGAGREDDAYSGSRSPGSGYGGGY